MKKQIKTAILAMISTVGLAQTPASKLPEITGPSPDAAAIQKFGQYEVSKYTGVPGISIPLYEIRLKDISVPISISYNASGIKVEEEASRVGLGWSLNTGGSISREIMGLDDLDPHSQASQSFNITGIPLKYAISQFQLPFAPANYNIRKSLGKTVDPSFPGVFGDFEPDIFYLTLPGYSGKFIIDKNNAGKTIFENPTGNFKVEFAITSATNAPIKVTDGNGTVYSFNRFEVCETSDGSVPNKLTAWYLTEIKTIKGSTVTYHYQEQNNGYASTLNHPSDYLEGPHTGYWTGVPVKTIMAHHRYNNLLLSDIEFAGGKILFTYADRIDIQGDKRLTTIEVQNFNNEIIKHYDLMQDYFTSNASTTNVFEVKGNFWGNSQLDANWLSKRLKLNALKETNTNNTEYISHDFNYNETLLPPKNSTSRDHWGYFNNADNAGNLIPDLWCAFPVITKNVIPPVNICTVNSGSSYFDNNHVFIETNEKYYTHIGGANRTPNPLYSQAFQLKKISYPTGGNTQFTFEQNTYDASSSFITDANAFSYDYKNSERQVALLSGVAYIPAGIVSTFPFTVTQQDILPGETAANASFTFYAQMGSNVNNTANATTYIRIKNASGVILSQLAFIFKDALISEGSNLYSHGIGPVNLPVGNYTVEMVLGDNEVDRKSVLYYVKGSWMQSTRPVSGDMFSYAGGLRIKNISNFTSQNNNTSSVNYTYHYQQQDTQGNINTYSTGKLLNRPNYWRLQFALPMHSIINAESSVPLQIGYDKVVTDEGNQRHADVFRNTPYRSIRYKLYYTESGDEVMPAWLGFPTTQNGKTLDVFFDCKPSGMKDFLNNANGKLIQSIDYKFTETTGTYDVLKQVDNIYSGDGNGINPDEIIWGDRIYASPQILNVVSVEDGYPMASCLLGLPPMYALTNFLYPAFRSVAVQPTQSTETLFSSNGSLATSSTFVYNSKNQLKQKSQINSKGEVITSSYNYPLDYSNTSIPWLQVMRDANMLSEVIEQRTGKEGLTTAGNYSEYGAQNGVITAIKNFRMELDHPEQITESTSGTFTDKYKLTIQSSYNASGNIIEQARANDIKEVYLWGYHSMYPVAKIIGTDYNTVISLINTSLLDNPPSDQALRDELQKIRTSLSTTEAQVFTYTYKPLVGYTSETDAKGFTTYYDYDRFNRLLLVKDHSKNIIKRYCYKYANQIDGCNEVR